jgi:GNAT superfamily N-acetyltransferase
MRRVRVSHLADGTGLRVDVWPTRAGSLFFPVLGGVPNARRVELVMSCVPPGAAVVVGDSEVRHGLLARGAQQVRHLRTMRHTLRDVHEARPVTGSMLRGWHTGDADLLAPALVAAYGPEHPDPQDPDLGKAAESLEHMVEDPDNPLMTWATQVATVDGSPVGAALVLRSEHISAWSGPWLMNMFRAPDPTLPGVGAALLTRALQSLRADGESSLGLAVTSTNPARRLYEKLGFEYDFEGWVLVLQSAEPGEGALGQ